MRSGLEELTLLTLAAISAPHAHFARFRGFDMVPMWGAARAVPSIVHPAIQLRRIVLKSGEPGTGTIARRAFACRWSLVRSRYPLDPKARFVANNRKVENRRLADIADRGAGCLKWAQAV